MIDHSKTKILYIYTKKQLKGLEKGFIEENEDKIPQEKNTEYVPDPSAAFLQDSQLEATANLILLDPLPWVLVHLHQQIKTPSASPTQVQKL